MNNRTPWVVQSRSMSDGALVIKDADNNEVCCLAEKADREYGKKDTERQLLGQYIINCVNSHDALARLAQGTVNWYESSGSSDPDTSSIGSDVLWSQARAALKIAKAR